MQRTHESSKFPRGYQPPPRAAYVDNPETEGKNTEFELLSKELQLYQQDLDYLAQQKELLAKTTDHYKQTKNIRSRLVTLEQSLSELRERHSPSSADTSPSERGRLTPLGLPTYSQTSAKDVIGMGPPHSPTTTWRDSTPEPLTPNKEHNTPEGLVTTSASSGSSLTTTTVTTTHRVTYSTSPTPSAEARISEPPPPQPRPKTPPRYKPNVHQVSPAVVQQIHQQALRVATGDEEPVPAPVPQPQFASEETSNTEGPHTAVAITHQYEGIHTPLQPNTGDGGRPHISVGTTTQQQPQPQRQSSNEPNNSSSASSPNDPSVGPLDSEKNFSTAANVSAHSSAQLVDHQRGRGRLSSQQRQETTDMPSKCSAHASSSASVSISTQADPGSVPQHQESFTLSAVPQEFRAPLLETPLVSPQKTSSASTQTMPNSPATGGARSPHRLSPSQLHQQQLQFQVTPTQPHFPFNLDDEIASTQPTLMDEPNTREYMEDGGSTLDGFSPTSVTMTIPTESGSVPPSQGTNSKRKYKLNKKRGNNGTTLIHSSVGAHEQRLLRQYLQRQQALSSLTFTPPSNGTPLRYYSPTVNNGGVELVVGIQGARNLRLPSHSQHKAHPLQAFVKGCLGRQGYKTKCLPWSGSPEWCQQFRFIEVTSWVPNDGIKLKVKATSHNHTGHTTVHNIGCAELKLSSFPTLKGIQEANLVPGVKGNPLIQQDRLWLPILPEGDKATEGQLGVVVTSNPSSLVVVSVVEVVGILPIECVMNHTHELFLVASIGAGDMPADDTDCMASIELSGGDVLEREWVLPVRNDWNDTKPTKHNKWRHDTSSLESSIAEHDLQVELWVKEVFPATGQHTTSAPPQPLGVCTVPLRYLSRGANQLTLTAPFHLPTTPLLTPTAMEGGPHVTLRLTACGFGHPPPLGIQQQPHISPPPPGPIQHVFPPSTPPPLYSYGSPITSPPSPGSGVGFGQVQQQPQSAGNFPIPPPPPPPPPAPGLPPPPPPAFAYHSPLPYPPPYPHNTTCVPEGSLAEGMSESSPVHMNMGYHHNTTTTTTATAQATAQAPPAPIITSTPEAPYGYAAPLPLTHSKNVITTSHPQHHLQHHQQQQQQQQHHLQQHRVIGRRPQQESPTSNHSPVNSSVHEGQLSSPSPFGWPTATNHTISTPQKTTAPTMASQLSTPGQQVNMSTPLSVERNSNTPTPVNNHTHTYQQSLYSPSTMAGRLSPLVGSPPFTGVMAVSGVGLTPVKTHNQQHQQSPTSSPRNKNIARLGGVVLSGQPHLRSFSGDETEIQGTAPTNAYTSTGQPMQQLVGVETEPSVASNSVESCATGPPPEGTPASTGGAHGNDNVQQDEQHSVSISRSTTSTISSCDSNPTVHTVTTALSPLAPVTVANNSNSANSGRETCTASSPNDNNTTSRPFITSTPQSIADPALIVAIAGGDLPVVKEYSTRDGFDVNATDEWQRGTLLHNACKYAHQDVIEFLIRKGANVNAVTTNGPNKGWTPIDWAVFSGKLESTKLLIARGANVDVDDIFTKVPLKVLKETHHTELADFLLNIKQQGASF